MQLIARLSKTPKGHVFYENKDILHKLIHIPIIERVKSQFFQKYVVKLAIIINAVKMINICVDIYLCVMFRRLSMPQRSYNLLDTMFFLLLFFQLKFVEFEFQFVHNMLQLYSTLI